MSEKGMNEITFVVAGRGTLEAVASFLYRVETAELPVKVDEHAAWLDERIRRQHVPAASHLGHLPGVPVRRHPRNRRSNRNRRQTMKNELL